MTKFLLVLIVFLLLPAASCLNKNLVNREIVMNSDLEKRLETKIKNKVESKDQTPFNIKSLTDFDWDHLYIFTPYTPFTFIKETIGEEADKLKKVNMDTREEINLLVFMNNGKIESYLEFPRRKGDFDKINRPEGFNPESASFIATIEDRGEPWITILDSKK